MVGPLSAALQAGPLEVGPREAGPWEAGLQEAGTVHSTEVVQLPMRGERPGLRAMPQGDWASQEPGR